eukprot:11219043-Lingulodinium_polyedra.AAC.1
MRIPHVARAGSLDEPGGSGQCKSRLSVECRGRGAVARVLQYYVAQRRRPGLSGTRRVRSLGPSRACSPASADWAQPA